MFEQVFCMALAHGAVSQYDVDCYFVHPSVLVHSSDFDADFFGSLCVALGYDVEGESYDDVLCGLLEMFGDSFDQDECGFSGVDEDGVYYFFVVDFED